MEAKEEQKQPTFTPDMLEGCFIKTAQVVSAPVPTLVMELEDRTEQRATLTVVPGAVPMLNGNILIVNPSITMNLTKKEAVSEKS